LTFDVFGTVVDWRSTVTSALIRRAAAKLSASSDSHILSSSVRERLSELEDEDWARFAQQWRNSYKQFTSAFKPGVSKWQDIDTHHYLSLVALLEQWSLESLYTMEEVHDLSLIWHSLEPWPDASPGLWKLGTRFVTSTLSNGNPSLLKDLNEHGKLGFQKLQSSADFKAYKPHPSVYRGAADVLGLKPADVAMVAAHLSDLRMARECGFRTIYVERRQEEDWKHDQVDYEEARCWVDMWVGIEGEGFLEVANRFGIS